MLSLPRKTVNKILDNCVLSFIDHHCILFQLCDLSDFFNYYTICFSQRTLRFIERSPYLKGTDIPPMPSLQRNMYLLLHYFPGRLCTVQCNLPIVYIVDFSSEDFDGSIVAGMQYWQ